MIYQQVALSGYAEWPKAVDAVIEAAVIVAQLVGMKLAQAVKPKG